MIMHPVSIEGFDTLEEAATEIGKLRYDALRTFLEYLTEEMEKQRTNDALSGKTILSDNTVGLIDALEDAKYAADRLFQISKKFMKKDLDDVEEVVYFKL
jgi:regulator of RNase E activity RraB